MLQLLLDPARCRFKVVSAKILTAEVVLRVRAENAGVVCIGTLPPQNLAHARYLCKRLRSHLPGLKILVGCWGWEGDRDSLAELIRRMLNESDQPGLQEKIGRAENPAKQGSFWS